MDSFSERSPQVMTLKLPRPAGKNSGRWMALGLARERKARNTDRENVRRETQTADRNSQNTRMHTQKRQGGEAQQAHSGKAGRYVEQSVTTFLVKKTDFDLTAVVVAHFDKLSLIHI